MTAKTDNQQLTFHAWLSRRGIASNYAGDGQYEEPRVQLAWEAWTTAVDEMRPRAAVEADRQGRMPSDEELLKVCESAGFLFHYDRYVPGSGYGLQAKAYTLENFRALLTRYGQPIVCQECGGDGAGGLHEDDCSQNSSSQPAASAEPDHETALALADAPRSLQKYVATLRSAIAAQAPAPAGDAQSVAAQKADYALDAARYRWLRVRWGRIADEYDGDSDQLVAIREAGSHFEGWDVDPLSLDRAIDAAIAHEQGD